MAVTNLMTTADTKISIQGSNYLDIAITNKREV
jgi:hypothetical protein